MFRAALLVTALCTSPAFAGNFTFVSIDVPDTIAPAALGINDSNAVVGYSQAQDGSLTGFTWANGQTTSLGQYNCLTGVNAGNLAVGLHCEDFNNGDGFTYNIASGSRHLIAAPAGYTLRPAAVSRNGIVVGSAAPSPDAFSSSAFMEAGGLATLLLPPGATTSAATAVNSSGLVIGTFSGQGVSGGFAYKNGSYTTFNAPAGGTSISPVFVSTGGAIAGGYYLFAKSNFVGFTMTKSGFHTLEYPKAVETDVIGITHQGAVIGVYQTRPAKTHDSHGFVRYQGHWSTFDFPGAVSTNILAINDQGSVAGYYFEAGNAQHAFVGICAADQVPCTQ